ncbi:domain of unknown function DUF1735 [Paludibacter propionicigenes WB4]|uniref:Adhesin n=1 Tax=Paludibacter propionicigenes (strain DSM 17365 / JCM 13257 / WB4) TaxID=694427 RepID=E4T1K6_PALPW|nr:DUF5627 domain-containing protein [Paludibacter propionicigenes]ADQ78600.1 domain of unknown function DUF1735 [Paludibacter propionicigenes WB4]
MKKLILFLFVMTSLSSCHNDPITFDDFKYSSVYFAYQYPVRTITLGEDIFDTSLDNQHKCAIYATMGGVYDNKKDVIINFNVADSICTGYNLVSNPTGGRAANPTVPISFMPHDYYTLTSNQIVIKKGDISGGVEVQLTDKFFADPKSLTNNYVIPLQMTTATNVDSILHGRPLHAGFHPRMLDASNWDVKSKDYVLYAIKYINTWHGYYLRRGIDVQTGSVNSTIIRHPKDVQTYDVLTDNASLTKYLCYLTSTSLTGLQYPVTLKDASGSNYTCNLILTFDITTGNCTISSSDPTNYSVSGTGSFVKKGEKNSFDNQDRDVLYLSYQINHIAKGINTVTKDTLVMRNRGVAMEQFTVK